MTAYATIDELETRLNKTFDNNEAAMVEAMLLDAGTIIDAFNKGAEAEIKKIVSLRMVMRALPSDETAGIPMGANQGTQSALGYSQTWTYSAAGSAGELYLGKMDKQLLRSGNRVGSRSPVEDLAAEVLP